MPLENDTSVNIFPRKADLVSTFSMHRYLRHIGSTLLGPEEIRNMRQKSLPGFQDQFYTQYSEWLRNFLELPFSDEESLRFARRQWAEAFSIRDETAKLIQGQYNCVLTPVEESRLYYSDPRTQAALPLSRDVDTIERFELGQQIIIALATAAASVEKMNRRRETLMANILDLFDRELWEGNRGATLPIDIYSVHDNDTVETAGAGYVDQEIAIDDCESNQHVKRRSVRLRVLQERFFDDEDDRYIPGILLKGGGTGFKSEQSIFYKAVRRVLSGESPDLKTAISQQTDKTRLTMAVMGDKDEVIKVENIVLQVIEQGIEGVRIKEDHIVSKKSKYRKPVEYKRYIITLGEESFELQFQSATQESNQIFEVGELDDQFQLYTGRAHGLYKLDQIINGEDMPISLGEWFFPEKLYFRSGEHSLASLIREREEEIAAELRRAAVFTP